MSDIVSLLLGLAAALSSLQEATEQLTAAQQASSAVVAEEIMEDEAPEEVPMEESEVPEEEIIIEEVAPEEVVPEDEIYTIVLDPGHTAVMSGGQEAIGPGASELKDKDTLGTKGVSSGVPEYELNLQISEKLKEELEERGYEVILTRDSHDLSLSCIERAMVANDNQADAFVRIHADASTSQSAKGAMTICTTKENPYHPEKYDESRVLSECLLNEYCKKTGAKKRTVWETDTMTGNNWSEVPCTIIEMGYMTNPDEDLLMQTEEYQEKMVEGIANGIDKYFLIIDD